MLYCYENLEGVLLLMRIWEDVRRRLLAIIWEDLLLLMRIALMTSFGRRCCVSDTNLRCITANEDTGRYIVVKANMES